MPSRLLIPVRLRLNPKGSEVLPTLWVLDAPDGRELLRELASHLDEAFFSKLTWVQSGSTHVLFWEGDTRPSLPLEHAKHYVVDQRLPNLFVPEGYRLTPTFRLDFLKQRLPLDPQSLTWLIPSEQGITVATTKKTAFKRVRDLLDYSHPEIQHNTAPIPKVDLFRLLPFAEENLAANSVTASAPEFVGEGFDFKELKAPSRVSQPGLLSRTFRWASRMVKGSSDPEKKPEAPKPETPEPSGRFESVVSGASVENQITRLEKQFLEGHVKKQSQASAEAWENLSVAYETAGAYPEAALSWLLAVWEGGEKAPQRAWGWLRSEARAARGEVKHINPRTWLEQAPSHGTTRVLAAWVVWANLQPTLPAEFRELAPKIQSRLDDGENALPVRAAWLARQALARVADGDVLLLAKSADRLIHRWADGPISDLDVPPFLRFPTHSAQTRHRQARSWITEKRDLIHQWLNRVWSNMPFPVHGHVFPKSLAPFGLEIDVPLTKGYADLLLAWGAAKFGEHTISHKFYQSGKSHLPETEPHRFLLRCWGYRIDQARKSRSHPIPSEIMAQVNSLETLPKHAVEKWLSASRVLQPSSFAQRNLYRPTNTEALASIHTVREYEEFTRSFSKEIARRNLIDHLFLDRVLTRTPAEVREHLIDEARNHIFIPTTEEEVRTQLIHGYVHCLRFLPVGVVVARLEELFSRMNSLDFFGSVNRYFCLPALIILEGAIRALVPPELEPGSPARLWLEADEWQVLRKIRTELQGALKLSGIEA